MVKDKDKVLAREPLSREDIKKMTKSCQLAAKTLDHIRPFIQSGITTNEIDRIVDDFFRSHGAVAATLNYHGYPKSCCTSINHVICHGVPDGTQLKEGDIINVDVTCILEDFFGDTSATYWVGQVSEKAKAITQAAFEAMHKGIEAIRPFGTTGDVGFTIDKFVTRKGYTAVREIGGHGIGRKFHEEPFVPSFGKKGKGDILKPWYCITVEPMINETSCKVKEVDIPGSSHKIYETADKCLSAQFEHTVLVTDTGYEVLTLI